MFMPLPGLSTVAFGGGAILCFHSVTSARLPAEGAAHVSIDVFRSTIRLARRFGQIVPLAEFVHRHQQGKGTAGLIAVTFDDAYLALRDLESFLEKEAVPVTVFVVVSASTTGNVYWWDRVDDLFPRVSSARWLDFETACGLPDAYRKGQPHEYGPLRPLRQWMLARYAGRWPDHLMEALERLETEASWTPCHRAMTWDELREFARTPGVALGVHTLTHPVLPLLSDDELCAEVAGGYSVLRSRFPEAQPILSIPFGLYDERTLQLAQRAGMTASLTLAGTVGAAAWRADAVPRLCVSKADTVRTIGLNLLGVPHIAHRWMRRARPLYPALPSSTT